MVHNKKQNKNILYTISFRRSANWESTDEVRCIEFRTDDADMADGEEDPEPASLTIAFCC